MNAPFTKFYVGKFSGVNMFRVGLWVKVKPAGKSKDWWEREVEGLRLSEKFIEDAIREKLEREKEGPK